MGLWLEPYLVRYLFWKLRRGMNYLETWIVCMNFLFWYTAVPDIKPRPGLSSTACTTRNKTLVSSYRGGPEKEAVVLTAHLSDVPAQEGSMNAPVMGQCGLPLMATSKTASMPAARCPPGGWAGVA